MSRWNRVETELVCKLYKQNANLYDKSHINYRSRTIRDNTLKEITKQLTNKNKKFTYKEVRMKIKTLRTQFTAELRNFLSHKEGNYKPKLWCYQHLKFLMEHLEPNQIEEVKTKKEQDDNSTKPNVQEPNDDVAYSKFLITLLNQLNDKEAVKWKILDFVREEITTQKTKPEKNKEITKTQDDKQVSVDAADDYDSGNEYIEIIVQNDDYKDEY